eukprot:104660-Chlamydomonas_euryale.AAC.1
MLADIVAAAGGPAKSGGLAAALSSADAVVATVVLHALARACPDVPLTPRDAGGGGNGGAATTAAAAAASLFGVASGAGPIHLREIRPPARPPAELLSALGEPGIDVLQHARSKVRCHAERLVGM